MRENTVQLNGPNILNPIEFAPCVGIQPFCDLPLNLYIQDNEIIPSVHNRIEKQD